MTAPDYTPPEDEMDILAKLYYEDRWPIVNGRRPEWENVNETLAEEYRSMARQWLVKLHAHRMAIKKLRELDAKATPGPWSVQMPTMYGDALHIPDVIGTGCDDAGGNGAYAVIEKDDADLIVAMRNAFPALLDRMEALEEVAKAARALGRCEGPDAWSELDAALARLEPK